MKTRFVLLIILGLVIRLILMPISLHPDLWAVVFAGKLFAYDGIFNIYDHLSKLSLTSDSLTINYGTNFFTYPPLAYFTFGLFSLIFKPFVSHDFINNLAVNLPNILSESRLYWHLFIFKLPYLIFDFGSLYFLRKLFSDPRSKLIASILWLLNPVVIYSTYLIGQFDIIPVFFCILSLYFAQKERGYLSVLMMGIGGAYKMYPLFFIPLIVILLGKDTRQKIILGIVGFLPYFLTILPFLGTPAFRSVVLLSNQSQKMFFAKIPVSGAEYLSLFIVGYIMLLSFSCFYRRDLWVWFGAVMLLFFSVTHYHPQWFIWLIPMLIITLVKYIKLTWVAVLLFGCWLLITLMFEPSLSIGLFTPLSHMPYVGIGLKEIISQYSDPYLIISIVRSIFAGISIGFMAYIFKLSNEKI